MPYDLGEIAGNSKGSKAGPVEPDVVEPDADADDTGEAADLRAAALAIDDPDAFAANMLSAIKTCIANYGAVK